MNEVPKNKLVETAKHLNDAQYEALLNREQDDIGHVQSCGEEALARLFEVAHRNSGQARKVASFLLGLYNGNRFPFNLNGLRLLDIDVFVDCIAVARMDYWGKKEVHMYFEGGGWRFEGFDKRWKISEKSALE